MREKVFLLARLSPTQIWREFLRMCTIIYSVVDAKFFVLSPNKQDSVAY